MSWWSIAPVLAVTVGVMLLPGLALALALRFRQMTALGLAPLFSVAIVGVAAVLGSLIAVPWSAVVVVGATVLFSAVAFLLTARFGRPSRDREIGRDSAGLLASAAAGVLIGGAIIAWRTVTLIGNPENIAQRFDNVFHLNAVEYIVSSGDASSLTLGEMTGNAGAAAVYPAAWHALGALVVQLTGTSVPIAVNSLNIVIAAVVWPLSAVLLARVAGGPRPAVLLAAGVLSAAFIGFPYLMMVWGPLFPYMLSVALLPGSLAVVLLSAGMGRRIGADSLPTLLSVPVAVAAVGLSHMSTVNALLLISLPALAVVLIRWNPTSGRIRTAAAGVMLKVVVGAAVLGLSVLVWLNLRPVPYDVWGPHQTPGGAVGEVLMSSPMGFPLVSLTVSVLGLVGIISSVRSGRHVWLLVSFVLVGYLYVVDAGLERGPWRAALTGIWYADTNRLAALLPLFGVLFGSLGVGVVVQWVLGLGANTILRDPARRSGSGGAVPRRLASAVGLAAIAALIVVSTQTLPLRTYLEGGEQFYLRDTPTSILSSDEYDLLERLDETLPADAVIAGNPWDGSTLAFAFTGREVLSYHLFETQSPADQTIAESLRDAASDPEVCDAIEETRVSHVLDFGTQYLVPDGGVGLFPGLEDLDESEAVRLIDQQGAAKLYEVVACKG